MVARLGALFLPLATGIPFITMTVGQPTLPFRLAIVATVTTLLGLAFALAAGSLAAQQLPKLIWLGLAGLGFIPSLLMLRFIELPSQGLMSAKLAPALAIGSCLVGVGWLTAVSAKYYQKWKRPLRFTELLLSGIIICYLILPLVHYFFLTPPGTHYITTSDNFFAKNVSIQLISFIVAILSGFLTIRYQQTKIGDKNE